MKLVQRLTFIAALSAMPCLHAQQPATTADVPKAKPAKAGLPAGPNKAAVKTPEELAAAKALLKAEREKVHTIATIDFKIGRSDQQILIELFPDDAPKTVANFMENVRKGTYKGVAVHRAIDDYLVQTGDPASKDKDAKEKWGTGQEYTIPGEFKLPHLLGSVAMARRSDKVNPKRESNGTQFYFALGNMNALNGSYAVFGQVVSGMEVLKQISKSVTDSNDCPLARIEIKDIKVTEQTGPLFTMVTTMKGKKHQSKPDALKGPIERFIERIW